MSETQLGNVHAQRDEIAGILAEGLLRLKRRRTLSESEAANSSRNCGQIGLDDCGEFDLHVVDGQEPPNGGRS